MDYPNSVPGVGLVDGKFVDEDQVSGTPGSLIPAQWGNAVTDELLNVLARSGIVPDEAVFDQLAQAIFDSPTFGPLALGTTAPQFDSSKKLATMEAVQRALGNYSGQRNCTAATVLVAADAGKLVVSTNGAAITLPLSADVVEGALITVIASAAACVVQKQGADTLNAQGAEPGPFTLPANTAAVFRRLKAGGGWYMDGGDFALKYSPMFGSALSASGYQKLPSGLIIQWSFIACSASGPVTWTYPIAFPNQVLAVGPLGVTASVGQFSNIGSPGLASCPVSAWDYVGARTANNVFMVAIGR